MSEPTSTRPLTILMNAAHGGGAEHVGRTWALELQSQGVPVRLLVVNPVDDRARGHLDPAVLALVETLGDGGRRDRYRRLRGFLHSTSSSAVVSLQMRPNLLVLLAAATVRRRRRTVVAISERNIVSVYAGRVSRAHRLRVALARRLYRRADVMLAISHPVAAEMIAGFGVDPSRCRVIPNPAAGTPGGMDGGPRRPAASGELELVLAGRLAPQKQPLLAVATAGVLAERGVPTRVVVFGEGPLRADLETAAERAGVALDLRGWVESWPEACPEGAVLLLPSMKEGFGNVLVEAAVHRVPSVAVSGALGVADAVVPGITGVLALDDRPETLAAAVLEARECTFAGVEDWLTRFAPDRSARLLLEAVART